VLSPSKSQNQQQSMFLVALDRKWLCLIVSAPHIIQSEEQNLLDLAIKTKNPLTKLD